MITMAYPMLYKIRVGSWSVIQELGFPHFVLPNWTLFGHMLKTDHVLSSAICKSCIKLVSKLFLILRSRCRGKGGRLLHVCWDINNLITKFSFGKDVLVLLATGCYVMCVCSLVLRISQNKQFTLCVVLTISVNMQACQHVH